MLLDIDAQRLRLAQEFLSGIEQKETTPYIKVGHYNDPLRWMMLLIFLPNIARSLSWAKLGVCVSRQAGTFWIVVSRWHRSGGETTFVTKSYQRRLFCACRLILVFLEQQIQVGNIQAQGIKGLFLVVRSIGNPPCPSFWGILRKTRLSWYPADNFQSTNQVDIEPLHKEGAPKWKGEQLLLKIF